MKQILTDKKRKADCDYWPECCIDCADNKTCKTYLSGKTKPTSLSDLKFSTAKSCKTCINSEVSVSNDVYSSNLCTQLVCNLIRPHTSICCVWENQVCDKWSEFSK